MRCKAGMLSQRLLAWDISTAAFVRSLSLALAETQPRGIFFKPDGLRMYVIGSSSLSVREWSLGTAWNIGTASFVTSRSVSTNAPAPLGLFFKPDGLKMYVICSSTDSVHEYDLATAWSISTISHASSFSVAAYETVPSGIFFKPDGLSMYVIGTASDDVIEFTLGTAWDITTSSVSVSRGVFATTPRDVFFRQDGLKMYVASAGGSEIQEYNLSDAWNISTAVRAAEQDFSVAAKEGTPDGVFFSPDGLKMYVVGIDSDSIHEYDIGRA